MLRDASDRICGNRLKPLLPTLVEAMERHGHLDLADDVRRGLLNMSAATIDRALRTVPAAGVSRPPGPGRNRGRPSGCGRVRLDLAPGRVLPRLGSGRRNAVASGA